MSGTFLKNNERVSEDGEPPKYEYFYLGKKDTPNNFVFYLEIKNVTMEDAGNYTCLAFKSEQESRETFLLEVGMVNYSFLHSFSIFLYCTIYSVWWCITC